jgi:hypothetical protein
VFWLALLCSWRLVIVFAIRQRFGFIAVDSRAGQCPDILVRPLVSVARGKTGETGPFVARRAQTEQHRRALGFAATDRKPSVQLLYAIEIDAGGGKVVPFAERLRRRRCRRQHLAPLLTGDVDRMHHLAVPRLQHLERERRADLLARVRVADGALHRLRQRALRIGALAARAFDREERCSVTNCPPHEGDWLDVPTAAAACQRLVPRAPARRRGSNDHCPSGNGSSTKGSTGSSSGRV